MTWKVSGIARSSGQGFHFGLQTEATRISSYVHPRLADNDGTTHGVIW